MRRTIAALALSAAIVMSAAGCKSGSGSSTPTGKGGKPVSVKGVDPCYIYPAWTVSRLLGVKVGKPRSKTVPQNHEQWSCTYSDSKGPIFEATTYLEYGDGSPYDELLALSTKAHTYTNMYRPGIQVPVGSFRIGDDTAVSAKDYVTVKVQLLQRIIDSNDALAAAIGVFSTPDSWKRVTEK